MYTYSIEVIHMQSTVIEVCTCIIIHSTKIMYNDKWVKSSTVLVISVSPSHKHKYLHSQLACADCLPAVLAGWIPYTHVHSLHAVGEKRLDPSLGY